MVGSSLGATDGTTFNPGDNLSGGGGTDTVNVSVSGTDGAGGLDITAFTLSGIERVMVANYESSEGAGDNTRFNMANATGVTTIGLNGSSATGDTAFTAVRNIVSAEMNAGAGDLSITYLDTAVSGTADTQNLTLSGVTAGTFTVAPTSTGGVETLAITSSGGTRNVLTGIANQTGLATITVAGDTAATLGTLGTAVTSVNASSNTGGITATMSATTTTAVTGSSGNDSITLGAVLTTGSVNAGNGTDTLVTTDDTHIATSALGAKFTNFETLSVSSTGLGANATRAQDVSLVSGITTVNVTSARADGTVGDTTHDVTLTNLSATANTLNVTGLANADATAGDDLTVTVSATRASNTSSDSMTINLGTSTGTSPATAGSNQLAVGAAGAGVILNISLANEETIAINSNGGSTGTNFLTTLTNTSATKMTATGARALDLNSSTSTVLNSIDASAMTGAFIIRGNSTAVASTIQGGSGNDTLTGGSAADSMTGGAGLDSITGAAGADTISGGDGNDTVNAGAGVDNVSGGDGDDTINVTTTTDFIGLTAAETVSGGAGNDILAVAENTAITLLATDLLGLSSIDRISIDGDANAGSITLTDAVYTANGISELRIIDADTVQGTLNVNASALTGTNAIHVTANVETAVPAAIADTLTGGAGNDTFVFSGAGLDATDTVVGGAGTDTISLTATAAITANMTGVRTVERVITTGNGGNVGLTVGSDDVLAASTTLTVDASSVTNSAFALTYAGQGITTATKAQNVTGTAGNDNITAGGGNDVVVAGDGDDAITGGGGVDNLSGGTGNDTFIVATTGTGFVSLSAAETVAGGTGNDILQFTAGTVTIAASDLAGVTSVETIEIRNTTQTASLTIGDAFFTSNGVSALTVDADTVTTGVFTLAAGGLTGTNRVTLQFDSTTNAANHSIVFGAGDDTIIADLIALDTGTITGGTGNDTIRLSLDTGNAQLTLATTVTGFETLSFGTAAGTIADDYSILTVNENVASGATLTVNGSNLTGALTFGGGSELDGKFSMTGGAGADALTGGSGVDTINGGSGNDTITGGLGADSLTGGSGADTFSFVMPTSGTSAYTAAQSNSSNTDTVTDWTSGTDKLRIDLNYSQLITAVTVDATVQTARAGTTLIQDNLSGARGQAVYDTTGSALYVNVNADNLLTTSDYKININPAATATATIAEGDINFSITGGSGADVITAGGGADTVSGGDGADSITGGAGVDSITGGAGADTVVGGAGADTIVTGSGIDVIRFTATTAALMATEGGDTLSSYAGLNATNTTMINFASGLLSNGTSNALIAVTAGGTIGANDVILVASDAIAGNAAMATAAGALVAFNRAFTTQTNFADGDRVLFVASGTGGGTTANSYGWLVSKGAGALADTDFTLVAAFMGIGDATAAIFGATGMTITTVGAATANTDIFTIG